MTVKIIDEIIKENYQSHQNVDISISQGANISLFRNTKKLNDSNKYIEIPTPAPLHYSISSIQETKAKKSDLFLTNSFVDVLNFQESSRSIFIINKSSIMLQRKVNKIR